MSDAAERAVVTWEGAGEPIVLTVYDPHGEVAVPLLRVHDRRPNVGPT
jgi:hypothetical protein